eukprot:c6087_g1_i1.p1 GENE.c6087_g1_i1~~c6087_g1_i1.p1  ORF type:complete len:377 (+),score=26.19 c6087_g1_i1:121-1131(+)
MLNITEFNHFFPLFMTGLEESACEVPEEEEIGRGATNFVWGVAIAASIAVSLLSLVGIVVLYHVGNDSIFRWLIGLSSGALIGDALLHLIPEALASKPGGSGHSHAGEGFSGKIEDKHLFGLSMVIVCGFFSFNLLEALIHQYIETTHNTKTSPITEMTSTAATDVEKKEEFEIAHAHPGNLPHSHKDLKSLSIVILLLDGFHNFLDGFALAGAFAISNNVGSATLAAIILHEIPQELGDFAIILKGGYSVFKALAFNLISALTCILGTIIGLGIIEKVEDAAVWIIAFTAGGFIYLGGIVLSPNVSASTTIHHKIVVLFGFIVGWVAMILILLAE